MRAVLLDFYGTLVEDDWNVVCDAAETAVPFADPATVASEWMDAFYQELDASHGVRFASQRAAQIGALEEIAASYDVRVNAKRLCDPVFAYWRSPRVCEETRSFLATLPAPTCVVSNVDRDDLLAALRATRLSFDHVLTSEDVRAYKPRPDLFVAGLAALGVSSDDAVHVGDSWRNDVCGALGVGVRAIWLNRRGLRRPSEGCACEAPSLDAIPTAMLR